MGCTNSTGKEAAAPERKKNAPHKIFASWELGEVLGEGGYSIVKLATNKETNQKAAVKIVRRVGISKEDEESLLEEVRILKSINHPNITSVFDFFEEKKHFYVVMELLEGGELFDRIVKKSCYNEKEARDLVFLLLNTIKHLHDKNIIHRDLKPENLLLKENDNDSDIKLADFGFATVVDGENIISQCGTPGYIAPDILKNEPYGKPVDMWSFGVILYILLGGYPPFHHDDTREMYKMIAKAEYKFHPDYWNGVSEEAKNMISSLLCLDTKKRLTVDQALSHKWMNKSVTDLEATNLEANLAQLRKYQATRKLKKVTRSLITIQRMKNLVKGAKKAAAESDREETAAEAEEQSGETRVAITTS